VGLGVLPHEAALGVGSPAMPGWACLQLPAGRGRGGRELVQQSLLPNPPLLLTGSWMVRGLNSKYPRQHGSVVQMGIT